MADKQLNTHSDSGKPKTSSPLPPMYCGDEVQELFGLAAAVRVLIDSLEAADELEANCDPVGMSFIFMTLADRTQKVATKVNGQITTKESLFFRGVFEALQLISDCFDGVAMGNLNVSDQATCGIAATLRRFPEDINAIAERLDDASSSNGQTPLEQPVQ